MLNEGNGCRSLRTHIHGRVNKRLRVSLSRVRLSRARWRRDTAESMYNMKYNVKRIESRHEMLTKRKNPVQNSMADKATMPMYSKIYLALSRVGAARGVI